MVLVAPSILSADFARLGDEIRAIDEAGADWIHLDVMDGHFVPNITFGAPVIRKIRKYTPKPFDVHLMIEQPSRFIEDFIRAGADFITIHCEINGDVSGIMEKIKKHGVKAGIAINPDTPIERILSLINRADLILIMTVNPGFGGQKFIEHVAEKIRFLSNLRKNKREEYKYLISVDGGINAETSKIAKSAGADVLVSGSYIFGHKDYGVAIDTLRRNV